MVYVDELRPTRRTRGWPYRWGCHLAADTVEELHAFAERIGLKRRWFQGHSSRPHYDLVPAKRALALTAGAREVSTKEIVEILRRALPAVKAGAQR